MEKFGKPVVAIATVWLISLLLQIPSAVQADDQSNFSREELLSAARELIAETDVCALITMSSENKPHVRIMDPFLPDDDFVIWLGTNINSRKVQEIKRNDQVVLLYTAPDGGGYVTLSGAAQIIDDPEKEAGKWKEGWEAFYPKDRSNYALIKFTPSELGIISFKHHIIGDEVTWAVPRVQFEDK